MTAFINHNATVVINTLQNIQSALSSYAVLCSIGLSPARPSDCPHLSVHLSHGWINQQESCAIAKMTARCALY